MLAPICRWVIPPLVVVLGLVAFRLFATATAELPSRGVIRAAAEPNVIAPRYDEPRVISDEQLRAVLDRVKPPTQIGRSLADFERVLGPQIGVPAGAAG